MSKQAAASDNISWLLHIRYEEINTIKELETLRVILLFYTGVIL